MIDNAFRSVCFVRLLAVQGCGECECVCEGFFVVPSGDGMPDMMKLWMKQFNTGAHVLPVCAVWPLWAGPCFCPSDECLWPCARCLRCRPLLASATLVAGRRVRTCHVEPLPRVRV